MGKPSTPAKNRALRRIGTIATVCAIAIAALWWWQQRKPDAEGGYRTVAVERGDIRVAISYGPSVKTPALA